MSAFLDSFVIPLQLGRTQGEINDESERWLEHFLREERRRRWEETMERHNEEYIKIRDATLQRMKK